MNKHHHPKCNSVLGAPPGVPIEQCSALPIARYTNADTGEPGVASFWMPTAEELALLNQGKAVRVMLAGRTHAPLYIGVDGDGML